MLYDQNFLIIGLFVSLFLLGLSAFFSAAETALISLSPQKAKRLALKNPSLAQSLLAWLQNPQDLLTVILVGNTFATVLFASTFTFVSIGFLTHVSGHAVKWIAWIVETIAIVILAEMAPKFLARSNPEKMSLLILPILARVRKLFFPFLWLLSFLKFLFPRQDVKDVLIFSIHELKAVLEEAQVHGSGVESQLGMMQKVLEINDRTAQDIMTPLEKLDYVEIDSQGKSPKDRELILDLIIEQGHTRTPIKWKGNFIGFIHSDDLLLLVLSDEKKEDMVKKVRKAMDTAADLPVNQLLQEFRTSGVYLGFVRDRNKKLIGIVTLEDVLEEITGEILDEYDIF